MSNILDSITAEGLKKDVPSFEIGDSVRVYVKIKEGDKTRTQAFDGTVIARKGAGANETFTVRHVAFGVGVEKVFPVHSPHIEKVVVESHSHVRRAKLYYLRALKGKAARLRTRSVESSK
ncbi:MAG: 50S ribosomal protein L19 [Kiritimatiellia bacterium]